MLKLPTILVPSYKKATVGVWQLQYVNPPAAEVPGYYSAVTRPLAKVPVLWNLMTMTTWMSITPLEIESHQVHVEAAHGHVVVGGLGMGMYLYNILRKPEVKSVTVVEKDAAVIELFFKICDTHEWPGIHKLTVLEGDIKALSKDHADQCAHADYLYVDIWPMVGDQNALPDTVHIAKYLHPRQVGWWCMEYDLIMNRGGLRDTAPGVRGHELPVKLDLCMIQKYGLPTAVSRIPNYMEYLDQVGGCALIAYADAMSAQKRRGVAA